MPTGEPQLRGADGESWWCPVDLSPANNKRHNITGIHALNFCDRETGGSADWLTGHAVDIAKAGAGRSREPRTHGTHAHTRNDSVRVLWRRFVFDWNQTPYRGRPVIKRDAGEVEVRRRRASRWRKHPD